jgi:hypothetical protein
MGERKGGEDGCGIHDCGLIFRAEAFAKGVPSLSGGAMYAVDERGNTTRDC